MDRLRELRVFVRVVELGSFSKAAADLTISQSTVTKNIAELETHLKVRLLNRNTRGISLTELGELYYERCKAALHELSEAESIISRRQARLEGTLRISTSVAFGRRIVAPMLIDFMSSNPGLRVDLSCDDKYVDLVSQGIDLALRMGRLADSSLGGRYLGRNPWIMVASPDYVANHGQPAEPTELSGHDCIVYSSVQGDAVWHLRGITGKHSSIFVKGRMRSNNLSTLLISAENGLGIAILPCYVADEALRLGRIVEVLKDYLLPDQELHAVFPSPKMVPNGVLSLIDFLKPRFRDQWWTTR
jgi:DNA-binding transcriptional LysR family regulator